MKEAAKAKKGFSLVEVNLAILLVALGMLVLFALFPAGLRESEAAVSDTNVGMFADFVFSGLEANASNITNWNQWADMATFSNAVAGSQLVVPIDGSQIVGDGQIKGPITYAGRDVKYMMMIYGAQGDRTRSATLWVRSGTYGPTAPADFINSSRMFFAQFYFMGM